MGHEKMQQAKFRRAHIQGFTGAGYLVRRGIQLQAVKINNVLGKLRRTAAQHRLDARFQLTKAERLGDVVIGTRFESLQLVFFGTARGQQDNGQRFGTRIAAKFLCQLDAADAGKHPVEQRQIR